MTIPTEPIGSIPRPASLIQAMQAFAERKISQKELDTQFENAVSDTIRLFENTGSPVITDGEQTKPSFATYPIHGATNLDPNGVVIPFADGHSRQLPTITSGPFRYQTYAHHYLQNAKRYTGVPVKQAVISASALSLLYPQQQLSAYSQEQFIEDLIVESEKDIRSCLNQGAYNVQIDFTEGRLAVKLDPSKNLLKKFIDLNQTVLARFSEEERKRIGIHTCPGGDRDSTHSADVDYAQLLPELFQMDCANFYIQMASERDRPRSLQIIRQSLRPGQRAFIGVIDPINAQVETEEEVQKRILEAAKFIPLDQLGTTDDCGFAPFGDDTSTSRQTAFDKIRARIRGNELASRELGI